MSEPGQFPDSVYDRIAAFLPADLRTSFYRYVAHVRTLQPDDDFVVIIQGMGILALLARQVPEALAIEREKLLTAFANLCRKHETVTANATDDVRKMFAAHQALLEQNIGTWQSREQQAVQALNRIANDFKESTAQNAARLHATLTALDSATKEHRAAAQAAQNWISRISTRENAWPCIGSAALGALAVFLLDHFWPK